MLDTPGSRWIYAGDFCQQMSLCTLASGWGNAVCSHQLMGLCRILLSADGFIQDTPVSRWIYAGYSCQQLGLCRILLSAVGFLQDTPVSSSWFYA
jgi:hypothetical protein